MNTIRLESKYHPELIDDYVWRAEASFRELRDQLRAYNPDLLIIIGGDPIDVEMAHTGVHDGVHYALGYCGSGVSMARLPEAPEGMEIVRVDVVIRLRKRD